MNKLIQDVRYGLRQLRKSPAFTLTVIATLALGIGANTAVFTLFDQVLLRMLPVERPKELVRFQWTGDFSGSTSSFGGRIADFFSYPMYKACAIRTRSSPDCSQPTRQPSASPGTISRRVTKPKSSAAITSSCSA
jgi:hypothetical protein